MWEKRIPFSERANSNAIDRFEIGCHCAFGSEEGQWPRMDKAFSLLSGALSRRGLKDHAIGALVVRKAGLWLEERLPSCKDHIRVRKVSDGVLFVECGHSVVLQECAALVPELKDYLAKECPFLPVSEVRIVRT